MSTQDYRQQLTYSLRRTLKLVSLDWLFLAVDLLPHLRKFICNNPSGPYEILDYEATLELVDSAGKKARFKKRQRVKFLQSNILAIEDYSWGDGDILVGYRCSPGLIADKYKESDRWNVLISLRETKSIGDVEEFHMEHTARDSFIKEEEWFQTEIRRSTRRLRMNVIFPRQRQARRAVVVERKSNHTTELGPEHIHILPDGRQLVAWETNRARGFEIYTLKWQW